MPQIFNSLGRTTRALAVGLVFCGPALAQDAETRLNDTIQQTEQKLDASVGLVIEDAASDWSFRHRADERVLMNSTFKSMLCGAVLEQVDAGEMDLVESIEIAKRDIVDYAPVTKTRVGATMTVGDLCFAALDMSDNTASNLLTDRLGGPQAVMGFLRRIGDAISRLDRYEPELNDPGPTGQEDTTTPAAMASTLKTILLSDALSPVSRAQLLDWMRVGGVTGALLRASAPSDWQIADKSGSGAANRNLVAMVTRPEDAPYFVAIYLSGAEVDFDTRNAALIKLSAAVIDVLAER